jgi:hypothetical protein
MSQSEALDLTRQTDPKGALGCKVESQEESK